MGRVMQVSVEFLGRTRISSRGREIRQSISFLAYLVPYHELDHPLAASPGALEPSLLDNLTAALGHYRGDRPLGWAEESELHDQAIMTIKEPRRST